MFRLPFLAPMMARSRKSVALLGRTAVLLTAASLAMVCRTGGDAGADDNWFGVADRLAALAHPTRFRLVALLCEHPDGTECGRVLAATIGLSETTISHHLRQLRAAGLIESERRGMSVYHTPRPELRAMFGALVNPDELTG
jgi:ArsR family transcriptional regulator, arsenate/arsenite/antimonite-responsive transcriptional repressor